MMLVMEKIKILAEAAVGVTLILVLAASLIGALTWLVLVIL